MPYIEKSRRPNMLRYLSNMQHAPTVDRPANCGELNFVICELVRHRTHPQLLILRACEDYIRANMRYQRINDAIGAVTCAGLECARRGWQVGPPRFTGFEQRLIIDRLYATIAAPYEDLKIKENGDIP